MEDVLFYPRKVWGLAIHISISCYVYCFGITAMNSCTENIGVTLGWGDSFLMTSIFTTLFPAGAVIGAIIGSPLAKKYGIRKVIIISNLVYIFSSFCCIIPTNYTFGLGRFVTGIVGGIFITIPAVFINEITPDQMTGKVGTIVQQAAGLAFTSSFAMGLIIPTSNLHSDPWNYLWMVILFTPALFSFYQAVYFLSVFTSESPGWLVQHGRIEEAKEALRFVYSEKGVEIGLKRLQGISQDSDSIEQSLMSKTEPTYWDLVCSKKYRKMMRISLGLNIGQQTSGSMAILLYSTTIFEGVGGGKTMARVYTFLMGLVTIFSGLITLPIIGKFGRRTILIFGQVLITLNLLILGLCTGIYETSVGVQAILIYSYSFVFALSLGATFWTYIGEVCIDKCISIGLTCNILTIVTLSFLFPIVQNLLGVSYCFYIISGLALILFIYEVCEVFETKGLSKQEIQSKVLD